MDGDSHGPPTHSFVSNYEPQHSSDSTRTYTSLQSLLSAFNDSSRPGSHHPFLHLAPDHSMDLSGQEFQYPRPCMSRLNEFKTDHYVQDTRARTRVPPEDNLPSLNLRQIENPSSTDRLPHYTADADIPLLPPAFLPRNAVDPSLTSPYAGGSMSSVNQHTLVAPPDDRQQSLLSQSIPYPPFTSYQRPFLLANNASTRSAQETTSEYDLQTNATPRHASSIPMSNTQWMESLSLQSATKEPERVPSPSEGHSITPARATPEPESPPPQTMALTSVGTLDEAQYLLPLESSSFVTKGSKKKSKMHECEICGKQFPRPSGLKTHMNTHNNVKPFPCGYPGCHRSFAVRSNAKRHLRTHGVSPQPTEISPAPFVVGFTTPTVSQATVPAHQLSHAPYKVRWMPPSLTTRNNVEKLKALSDEESCSDDESDEGTSDRSVALSIPLPAVVPSIGTDESHIYHEERNSYLEAGSHPYHPSQFRVFPGPSAVSMRTHVAA